MAPVMAPKRRVSVFLDVELLAGLKAIKAERGVPEAETIRRAIAAHLEREGVLKADRRPVASRRRRS